MSVARLVQKFCSGQGGTAQCWCCCLPQGWVLVPGLGLLQVTEGTLICWGRCPRRR